VTVKPYIDDPITSVRTYLIETYVNFHFTLGPISCSAATVICPVIAISYPVKSPALTHTFAEVGDTISTAVADPTYCSPKTYSVATGHEAYLNHASPRDLVVQSNDISLVGTTVTPTLEVLLNGETTSQPCDVSLTFTSCELTGLGVVAGTEMSATPYAYTLGDPSLVVPLSSYLNAPTGCGWPVTLSLDVTHPWLTFDATVGTISVVSSDGTLNG